MAEAPTPQPADWEAIARKACQEAAVHGIKEAVAAERERCAKIAEGSEYGVSDSWDSGYCAACREIAAKIREGV